MKIGHIHKETDKAGKQWLSMQIAIPMMGRTRFGVAPNKDKTQGDNQPDFILYYNPNARGQRIYGSAKVGALWNKVSESGKTYKSGSIETPLVATGRLHIAIFEAIPKEGEALAYTHEVVWTPPRQDNDNYGYAPEAPTAQPQSTYQPPVSTAPNGAPVIIE